MKITKEQLKRLIKEEASSMMGDSRGGEFDRHDDMFFQFMRGARDEVDLLPDEDKKALLGINYRAGNESVGPGTIAMLADMEEGYETRWLANIMRVVEQFREIKANVDSRKDEEFHQGRADMADRIYPPGSRKD